LRGAHEQFELKRDSCISSVVIVGRFNWTSPDPVLPELRAGCSLRGAHEQLELKRIQEITMPSNILLDIFAAKRIGKLEEIAKPFGNPLSLSAYFRKNVHWYGH
jgi:hypothetical protein